MAEEKYESQFVGRSDHSKPALFCFRKEEQEVGNYADWPDSGGWTWMNPSLGLSTAGHECGAPFAQDYDGGESIEEQNAFARWVKQKSLFKSCTWEEYHK